MQSNKIRESNKQAGSKGSYFCLLNTWNWHGKVGLRIIATSGGTVYVCREILVYFITDSNVKLLGQKSDKTFW